MRMKESAHQVVITGRDGGATEWAERVNGGVKMLSRMTKRKAAKVAEGKAESV